MGRRPFLPEHPERPRPEQRGRLRPNPPPEPPPTWLVDPAEVGELEVDDEGRVGHRIVPKVERQGDP